MIDPFDKYKYLLGETVMLYQLMENDLKLMYAGMLDGDFAENIDTVRSTYKGLGQIVQALELLDNSDSTPYFDEETYKLLNKLARQRNYYCHQCCVEFCYDPYFRDTPEFEESLKKLERTNEIIKFVQPQASAHKENVLARYKCV